LSEYQIREFGYIIDSVARKHRTLHGGYGTQTFYLREGVHLEFTDRGALMGFEILPYQENDDKNLEVYTITGDHLWNPKSFKDDSEENLYGVSPEEQTLSTNKTESNIHSPGNVLHPYDPTDLDAASIGTIPNVEFNAAYFTTNSVQVTPPKEEKEKKKVGTYTSWHRVKYNEIDPKIIQPYLGHRPLRIISKTLERTTQMARMITHTPLRKHLQPRFSDYCHIKRLNELVSTDPIFANCRSVGEHFTGAQIFYCQTSHRIRVYGFHSKGEFPRILRTFIRDVGAPSILRRDNAKEENSEEVARITNDAYIKDQFSEP
jgi:hypothetical protein